MYRWALTCAHARCSLYRARAVRCSLGRNKDVGMGL